MKKVIYIGLVVILLASLFLAGCGGTNTTGKKVVLRENVVHPATDYMAKYTQTMANRFNTKWADKYEITVHPGGALLGMGETLDGVRTGAVEISQFPPGVFSNTDVRFTSAELPFLYNNIEANIAACDKLLPIYDEMMMEKYNQKALALWTATSLDLICKKPIKTMDDFKGLKLMAINPPTAAVIETFGGSPVSIDFPDAYDSISKGVVEGGLFATTQMVEYKMWEVAKYVVPIYMVPTFIVASINLDVWKSLPKDVQDSLLQEHQQMAHDLNALYEVLVTTNPDTLKEHGCDVYFVPKAERDRMYQAMKPWIEEKLAAMGDFGKKIQKVADEINAKYPYVGYIDQ
jgi:TRAP-type transport system periplasmic protein